jgi:hypothetical protein
MTARRETERSLRETNAGIFTTEAHSVWKLGRGIPLREGSKRELAQGVWARRIRSCRKTRALPHDYDPHADAVTEAPIADLLEPS